MNETQNDETTENGCGASFLFLEGKEVFIWANTVVWVWMGLIKTWKFYEVNDQFSGRETALSYRKNSRQFWLFPTWSFTQTFASILKFRNICLLISQNQRIFYFSIYKNNFSRLPKRVWRENDDGKEKPVTSYGSWETLNFSRFNLNFLSNYIWNQDSVSFPSSFRYLWQNNEQKKKSGEFLKIFFYYFFAVFNFVCNLREQKWSFFLFILKF